MVHNQQCILVQSLSKSCQNKYSIYDENFHFFCYLTKQLTKNIGDEFLKYDCAKM
jgi:hypothetical protein